MAGLLQEARKLKTGLGVQLRGRHIYFMLFLSLLGIFLENCITFFFLLFEFSLLGGDCSSLTVPWEICSQLFTSCFVWVICSSAAFLSVGATGILGCIILCVGAVLWLVTRIPGLYPVYSPKLSLPKMPPDFAKCPQQDTTAPIGN